MSAPPPPPLPKGDFVIDNQGATLGHYTILVAVASTIISAYVMLTTVAIISYVRKTKTVDFNSVP